MSLTSYQAAPPRVVSMPIGTTKANRKVPFATTVMQIYEKLAPAVGFGGSFPCI